MDLTFLTTMYEVSSMSELKSLIKMDGRSLPEGAK